MANFWQQWTAKRQEISPRLQSCVEALAARAAAMESDFLAVGVDLKALAKSATELSEQIESMTQRLQERITTHRFSGGDGLVAKALENIRTGISEVRRELAQLESTMQALVGIEREMEGLRRLGTNLQSSAVGFAIESARNSDCQQAFGSFVDEIRVLARRVSEVEGSIKEELTRTKADMGRHCSELQAGLGALDQLTGLLERTSEQAANKLQSRLSQNGVAIENARRDSATLRQQIEESVFRLQFGDIARQKIEHVVAALREGFSPSSASSTNEQLLAIQVAQLNSVADDVATAKKILEESLGRIAEAMTKFGELAAAGDLAGQPPAAQQSGELRVDFDRLLSLEETGRDLRHRAGATAKHAINATERLAGQIHQVETINRDMHLLALNAIVKSAALGQSGVTLEVLSMHVHELYRNGDTLVAAILRQTGTIRGDCDAAGAAKSESPDVVDIQRQLEAGVRAVSGELDEFDALAAAATRSMEDQRTRLAAAAPRLDVLRVCAEDLRLRAATLDEIRRTLDPSGRAVNHSRVITHTDSANRYTMESERAVHARVAGKPPMGRPTNDSPPPVSLVAVPADVPANDSFGDNVEMF